ncbi:thermonuclease family protein [Jiella avicenniae]|uniref:Endonuclease YncB, thermonuclease family n=1 Tax=Jiella avicenniae TaxID=2907202 RepID=A0A9X1P4Z0_9HYPH|nr:hypothetical protein [Jiella avicenniae]MCE7029373.1 hypothetical protein [Jiella avicenniae]
MRSRLDLEDVRRVIVVAVSLVLVTLLLLWLAPEKGDFRTVFDAVRSSRLAAAESRRQETATRIAEHPESGETTADDPSRAGAPSPDAAPSEASGTADDGALERLPPRPPLSDETLRADTPKPQLLPRPVALDGARIAYRQGTINLPGVEALPLDQRCGTGAEAFPCGVMARTELRRFLRGRSIECDVPPEFGVRRGEATSACTVAGDDIGRWVVENGWGKATAGGPYAEAQAAAKKARRGVWQYDAVPPAAQ